MAYKSIRIDDERELKLKSNAATIIIYYETFHEDLMTGLEKMTLGNVQPTEAATIVARLAYVMNRQAEEELSQLGTQDFYSWLSSFGATEMFAIMADVLAVWNENARTGSKSKNA